MAIQQTTAGRHSEYESVGIRNNNMPAVVERIVRPVVYKQIRIGMPRSLLKILAKSKRIGVTESKLILGKFCIRLF